MALSLPTFQMFLRWDEKPLKSNHLKRFSLVLQGPARQEIEIRGFLVNKETMEIMPPMTIVGNSPYEIAPISQALNAELLRSFHYEQMVGAGDGEKAEVLRLHDSGLGVKELPDGI